MDDTRKRSYADGDLDAAISSKRAALGGLQSDGQLFLKLLCPTSVTGSIIGRGGAVINEMNQTTGAKIKISQNHEFYPGTNDRVLVISGSQDNIRTAVGELVRRIIEAADRKPAADQPPQYDAYGNLIPPAALSNRPNQIRLLIPATAAGIVIGRGGSMIKSMAEETSCHMQLVPSDNDPYQTKERIMVINSKAGLPQLIAGAQRAVSQMYMDPALCIYANTRTSYLPSGGPMVGGMNMNQGVLGGGLLMNIPGGIQGVMGQQGQQGMGGGGHQRGPPGGPNNSSGGGQNRPSNGSAGQQQMYQSTAPYGNSMGGMTAMGPMGQMGMGQMGGMNQMGMQQMAGMAGQMNGMGQMGHAGGVMTVSQPSHSYQTGGYDFSGGMAAPMMAMAIGGHQASLGPEYTSPTFSSDGTNIVMVMGVSDAIIGAILGRGGTVVKEIKQITGTDIQVSQKDAYIPGTKHRSVTVKGLQHQVNAAQAMIMQKLLQHQQQHATGNMMRGAGGGR